MWGTVIGDIVGSVYEFAPTKEKAFEPFFHPRGHFTDDTLCTVALAEALLKDGDPAAYLRKWCNEYSTLSFGGNFQFWFRSPDAGAYQSYGNGAAMRVSPAAMLGTTLEHALALSDHITGITHDHEEGIKGARAVTEAIWLLHRGAEAEVVRERITKTYGYALDRTVDQIRPSYRFDETCQGTVPEAILCALESHDFEDTIRNAVSLGGDSDTVAAIAGSMAEARFSVPEDMVIHAKSSLPVHMTEVLTELYATAPARARA
jgi:ADP-ribosyl-[dinitrogen reductase] hydrolase